MLGSLYSRGSIGALEALLQFAGDRHRVIAGNIANVDTEGYRTRDLPTSSFERALARAFDGRRETGDFEMPPTSLAARPAADAGSLKSNGNNVDLDIEMAKLAKNHSLHSTAAALLAQQFAMLREAVSERVA